MRKIPKQVVIGTGLIAILFVATLMVYKVDVTEYAVVTQFGNPVNVNENPGLKVKLPDPVQSVQKLDKRVQVYQTNSIELLTLDKKSVSLDTVMEAGVGFFVDHSLLPLASVFIEPAKVLFLNNAINHGILSPMGIQQVEETGKSIFFLLEANPGPGLGILLAYCLAGKGSAKSSAPGAVIIHFIGGIHEIYFPYILMNPLLLLAVIAGGASGIDRKSACRERV